VKQYERPKRCSPSIAYQENVMLQRCLPCSEKPHSLGLGIFTFASGPAVAYVMPGKNAADLMIDQMNSKGGIGGVRIAPIREESAAP
jgi:branched-chain amino acid transport system substrate-binding protein